MATASAARVRRARGFYISSHPNTMVSPPSLVWTGMEFGPARVSDRKGIRVVSSRVRRQKRVCGGGLFWAWGLVPDAGTMVGVEVVVVVLYFSIYRHIRSTVLTSQSFNTSEISSFRRGGRGAVACAHPDECRTNGAELLPMRQGVYLTKV